MWYMCFIRSVLGNFVIFLIFLHFYSHEKNYCMALTWNERGRGHAVSWGEMNMSYGMCVAEYTMWAWIYFFFSKKWIAILQCLLWCPPATVIQQLLTRSFIVAFALFVHIHIWLLAGFGGWRGYVTSLTPAHRTATQHNLCIPTLRYDFLFNHILSWLFHARPY